MDKTLYILALTSMMLLNACRKVQTPDTASGRDHITFYVDSENNGDFGTKAMIEDTDALLDLRPSLYVTDEGDNKTFTDTEIAHYSNGIWRSDQSWEDGLSYIFFGYVTSPGNGAITPSSNGTVVNVKEPESYSKDTSSWADYLMSYRVIALGSNKPLINLQLERITAGVQLYLAQPAGSKITVKSIKFSNIYTEASYSLTYHASAADRPSSDNYNMKNVWAIASDSYSNIREYTLAENIELNDIDSSKGRFHKDYLTMDFLAVHQSARNHTLTIEYTSLENGVPKDYTASFDLGAVPTSTWTRGHRIRYYISFDTSLKLEGSIVPWRTVDDIEVTLLPPLS